MSRRILQMMLVVPLEYEKNATGRVLQRHRRGERAHVEAAVEVQHRNDVGDDAVHVVLGELQPAAHLQQLIERDVAARIAGALPLRNRRGRVHVDASLPHQNADERLRDALRHRPRILQIEVVRAGRISLVDRVAATARRAART